MALDVGTLQAKLDLDTARFNKGISAAQKKTKGFGSKLTSTFSKLKVPILAGAGALAAVGAASFQAATKVDESYAYIRRGTGATGDALDSLKEQFHDVYGAVPASTEEASTAIADLNTRLGLTGDELEERATQFLELANVTGGDVGTQIEKVTRLFGDFSVSTEDQAGAMDYLYRVSQATGASVEDLSGKAVQYGTSLRGMGFDMETSIAMLGKFEREGVNAETVMSSMKIGLGRMAKEGVTDANEAFSQLIGEIKNANSSTEATAKAMDVFGSRAAADMAMAIREGRFDIEDFTGSLKNSSETIGKAAEESMTFSQKMEMFKARATEALLPLGNLIMDALTAIMDWWDQTGSKVFAPLFDALGMIADGVGQLWEVWSSFWSPSDGAANEANEWMEENGPLIEKAAENIGKVISAVVEGLKVLFEAVWPIIANIVEKQLGVIMDVVAVFAALLAGDWEALGDRLNDLAGSMMDLMISLISAPLNIIHNIWNATFGQIFGTTEEIGQGIADTIGGVANTIKSIISTVVSIISAQLNITKSIWNAIFGQIFAITQKISRGISNTIQSAARIIQSVVSMLLRFIQPKIHLLVSIFTTAKDMIMRAFNMIGSGVRAVINPVINALNTLIRGLNRIHFDVPDWVPYLGGKRWGFNIPSIPHLAEGGIVTSPTVALIGESGPEAVVPLDSGGGVTNTFNISELVVREEADVKRIARELYTMIDVKNRARGI